MDDVDKNNKLEKSSLLHQSRQKWAGKNEFVKGRNMELWNDEITTESINYVDW